jgi:hypothetical protein
MVLSFVFFGCKAGQALQVVTAAAVVGLRVAQVAAAISQANASGSEPQATMEEVPAGYSAKQCTELHARDVRPRIVVCKGRGFVMDGDGHLQPLEDTTARERDP